MESFVLVIVRVKIILLPGHPFRRVKLINAKQTVYKSKYDQRIHGSVSSTQNSNGERPKTYYINTNYHKPQSLSARHNLPSGYSKTKNSSRGVGHSRKSNASTSFRLITNQSKNKTKKKFKQKNS